MTSLRRFLRPEQIRELILVLVILALIAFFGSQINEYFSGRTFTRISTSLAIIAVVAVGETLVFLTRNYDLSVGSIVGFTAYFVGTLVAANNGITPVMAILLAMGIGAAMGSLNGVLVAYGRVPAIIVTLGTMAIYRTVLVEFSGAKTVVIDSLPKWMQDLSRSNAFTLGDVEVRLIVAAAIVVVVAFQVVLTYLPYGRRLHAVGSNPDAASVAGFASQRIVFFAFVLCGALAGLAGFIFLGRFGNITVVAGVGTELQAIAAVVVGGVSTLGGAGTAIGALLGATLIGVLEQSLRRWVVINEFWRDALLGMLILLAVASDNAIMNRLRTVWARSELRGSGATAEGPTSATTAEEIDHAV